ncbi:maleylpyruvate isomerase family mycothiol-dependent enzyme [Mycolicibacterium sp. 050232]|uniref:maleylpyruvate isomerase family mycothiol-dependent enzyme n=1 Tax=Mycolicibacterium sp. 050232 TaxID=3113982 RepID=UPI002E28A251|nr:maleylpyruvate isomerase family mycothiol-dependent enzyme [Mycolicibacterium sp. 050232]MED5816009.1 maleylpyruvate isomerase family mycothiol-dependent enzyme [Mycolicibacterium sp. 050232]
MCETALRHAATKSDHELISEMRATIGSRRTPIGTTPADRLMDLLVHGQDIAVPLGVHYEMPAEAAQLALERVWHPRFPFRAATKFGSYRLRATDMDWAAGSGPLIEGPVSALLLLATGRRTAALPRLRGDGVELLRT